MRKQYQVKDMTSNEIADAIRMLRAAGASRKAIARMFGYDRLGRLAEVLRKRGDWGVVETLIVGMYAPGYRAPKPPPIPTIPLGKDPDEAWHEALAGRKFDAHRVAMGPTPTAVWVRSTPFTVSSMGD